MAEDEPHPQEVGGRNIHSNEQGYWELYVIVCGKFTLIISQTTSNIIIVLLALIKICSGLSSRTREYVPNYLLYPHTNIRESNVTFLFSAVAVKVVYQCVQLL